jgi:hypothetical protein
MNVVNGARDTENNSWTLLTRIDSMVTHFKVAPYECH